MTEPLSDLDRLLVQFRRAVLRGERAAAGEMVRRYGEIWKRVKRGLSELQAQITDAQKAGEAVNIAWLLKERRLAALKEQIEAEMTRFGAYVEGTVTTQQASVVTLAQQHAEALARAALGPVPAQARVTITWTHLNTDAVREIIGAAQDGAPLQTLLAEMGAEVGRKCQDALIRGIALGLNPRETARELRDAMGYGLQRALVISRTETLRAYREATRASYADNDDVVKGWRWRAALDGRTCPMCWAMHGTVHRMNEKLDDHPNGRCMMEPLTRSWDEIGKALGVDLSGVPETRRETVLGVDAFAKASADVQRSVLGGPAYKAFTEGKVGLGDFVARRRSNRWGTMRYAKSLKAVLAEKGETLVAVPVQVPEPKRFMPATSKDEVIRRMQSCVGDYQLGDLPLEKQNTILAAVEDVAGRYKTDIKSIVRADKRKSNVLATTYNARAGVAAIEYQKQTLGNIQKTVDEFQRAYGALRERKIAEYASYVADPRRAAIRASNEAQLAQWRARERFAVYLDSGVDPLEGITRHELYHAVNIRSGSV